LLPVAIGEALVLLGDVPPHWHRSREPSRDPVLAVGADPRALSRAESGFEEAFATYEKARKPRAEELVERSTLMAGVFHDGPHKYSLTKD
jgi:2-polyprenyl-6-methoxyphenol hydroxylase-like FAD-dependent oxidoreductase